MLLCLQLLHHSCNNDCSEIREKKGECIKKRKASALNNLGLDINDVEDEFSIGNAASFVYLISNTGLLFIFLSYAVNLSSRPKLSNGA